MSAFGERIPAIAAAVALRIAYRTWSIWQENTARAIYIFGRQTIGLPAARATASVLRKAANDIVVNLRDGNLRAL
jgi:hypothetical protein